MTITIKPVTKLSPAAEKLIGKRPVYDVTVSFIGSNYTAAVKAMQQAGIMAGGHYGRRQRQQVQSEGWSHPR